MECRNELNLCKTCIKKAKIKCLCASEIVSKVLCADDIKAVQISAENENVNTLCVSESLKAQSIEVNDLNVTSMCSHRASINQLCVDDLTVRNLNHCEKFRAAATFSATTAYTLGTPINWDTIVDDPNGNISLAPFEYTVPASGYYIVTFHLDHINLSGPGLITGIPVGISQIKINGTELTNQLTPYLSFSDQQETTVTTLSILNAGDKITMAYDVLILTSGAGLQPYVGTIDILAEGPFLGKGGFGIHYLSSLNCSTTTCQPCTPPNIPCQPVSITCNNPCFSSMPTEPCFDDEPCSC